MFKLRIDTTVHNSIRVWMEFEAEKLHLILDTKEFKLFELLSVWGGYDRRDAGVFSWEFKMSLSEYFKDKFAHYPDCKIQLI